MSLAVRPSVWIGGASLIAGAWVLEWLHPGATHFGETMVWGAAAVGAATWLLRGCQSPDLSALSPKVLDRAAVEAMLQAVERRIQQLETEIGGEAEATLQGEMAIANLRTQLATLWTALNRQALQVAVVGSKSVGKTTLIKQIEAIQTDLPRTFSLHEINLPASTTQPEDVPLQTRICSADLVLFLTKGDLTDSDYQTVQQLVQRQHRVLVVLTQQDQYLPGERPLVLQQVRERVQGKILVQDVVAIAAQPAVLKVRQQQADGTLHERLEQPAPDLLSLTERLTTVLHTEADVLLLTTVQRQAEDLKASVQTVLNQLRRDRALPLIEQSQWVAAAAAFATPVPSLDLLATAAITTQLVADLGRIYQQQFSLEREKTIATTLAELMVKLGLVELSTQAIAPLLKSNALTFAAGGLLQGISAAYLTRIAGLTLASYFEEQSALETTGEGLLQLDRLTQKLKAVFQENQRGAFVQTLVQQGISRLMPTSPATTPAAS